MSKVIVYITTIININTVTLIVLASPLIKQIYRVLFWCIKEAGSVFQIFPWNDFDNWRIIETRLSSWENFVPLKCSSWHFLWKVKTVKKMKYLSPSQLACLSNRLTPIILITYHLKPAENNWRCKTRPSFCLVIVIISHCTVIFAIKIILGKKYNSEAADAGSWNVRVGKTKKIISRLKIFHHRKMRSRQSILKWPI